MLALALAAAGIYGVMSHLVSLRTPEIGVRLTLGARPFAVMRQVLGEGVVAGGDWTGARARRIVRGDEWHANDPVRRGADRSVDAGQRRGLADAGRTPRGDRTRTARHAGRSGHRAQSQ